MKLAKRLRKRLFLLRHPYWPATRPCCEACRYFKYPYCVRYPPIPINGKKDDIEMMLPNIGMARFVGYWHPDPHGPLIQNLFVCGEFVRKGHKP